jgi:hypothetical protein
MAVMTDLVLKPAPANPGEFYVIADDQIVGRILLSADALPPYPWMWVLDYPHQKGRTPSHGYAESRDAATQAFAISWYRE